MDPVRNVREAHARYLAQGMAAWRASEGCWGGGFEGPGGRRSTRALSPEEIDELLASFGEVRP